MLPPKIIQATRQWYADNALACITEAQNGVAPVNDLPKYVEWQNQRHDAALAGAYDSSFAFRQRAHFIQAGECIALLPK